MKGVILLLLLVGGLFYCYKYTTLLDPYLAKFGVTSTAVAGELTDDSVLPAADVIATPDFVELKSHDGRVMQATVISRGPVGIRAKRTDGQVFEIPFEKLDEQTVTMLKEIQSFPYP